MERTVSRQQPQLQPENGEEVVEEQVKRDRIRLKCDKSGNWDPMLVDLKV